MKTVGRISVVAICYLLSSYGILLSLMLIGMSGIKSLSGALIGVLILLAWGCHVIMSINWVIDKPAPKWVPAYGTLAGTLALILWPLADSTIKNFGIADIFCAAAMGIAFTLPCFFFGYLSRPGVTCARKLLVRAHMSANHSVERDRPQAALVGSLRGFAATAAPHVKR